MHDDDIQVQVGRDSNYFGNEFSLAIRCRSREAMEDELSTWSFGEPVVYAPRKVGEMREPALRFGLNAAEQMMEHLWNLGVRPKECNYGSLSSMNNHLQDMRSIAFNRLKIEK